MKFKKKPVVIEAHQHTGPASLKNMPEDFQEAVKYHEKMSGAYCSIETLEGEMHVSENDFVIKGVKGEFYPCKPDIFAATYEIAEAVVTSFQRQEFEMSDDELTEFTKLNEEKDTDKLLAFWVQLGDKYRFNQNTLGPVRGKSERYFTAVTK